jgi:hypothetical protein
MKNWLDILTFNKWFYACSTKINFFNSKSTSNQHLNERSSEEFPIFNSPKLNIYLLIKQNKIVLNFKITSKILFMFKPGKQTSLECWTLRRRSRWRYCSPAQRDQLNSRVEINYPVLLGLRTVPDFLVGSLWSFRNKINKGCVIYSPL